MEGPSAASVTRNIWGRCFRPSSSVWGNVLGEGACPLTARWVGQHVIFPPKISSFSNELDGQWKNYTSDCCCPSTVDPRRQITSSSDTSFFLCRSKIPGNGTLDDERYFLHICPPCDCVFVKCAKGGEEDSGDDEVGQKALGFWKGEAFNAAAPWLTFEKKKSKNQNGDPFDDGASLGWTEMSANTNKLWCHFKLTRRRCAHIDVCVHSVFFFGCARAVSLSV